MGKHKKRRRPSIKADIQCTGEGNNKSCQLTWYNKTAENPGNIVELKGTVVFKASGSTDISISGLPSEVFNPPLYKERIKAGHEWSKKVTGASTGSFTFDYSCYSCASDNEPGNFTVDK